MSVEVLKSERIARRYEKVTSRVLMAERNSRAPAPLVLDSHASGIWRKFLMQLAIYLVTKAKDEGPDKLKVSMLITVIVQGHWEAIEEYYHFVFNEGESNEFFADVCTKFKGLREGARNVIYERLVLR